MNPWKIIGWIVLAVMVLFLYACGKAAMRMQEAQTSSISTPGVMEPPPVTHTAQNVGFTCESSAGGRYTIAKVTIRNTGGEPIPFAKLFVNFTHKGQMAAQGDSYFSPTTIPPGATASADVMQQGQYDCNVQAIQDGSGNPISLQ